MTARAIDWARRRPLLAVAIFYLVLLFIEFPGVLLLRQVPWVSEILGGSDLLDFNYPMRLLLSQAIRHGHIPLWTDAINCGFPVHAEGQGGFLYPPNLLLAFLPLAASVNLSFVISYLGAGVCMFLYARALGQSRPASAFAGMVFMLSGFMFGHIRHTNMVASAQWLPLLLLLCERYAQTRRPHYLVAAAGVQALQYLAGHPQVAYISILFAALYLPLRVLFGARPEEAPAAGRPAAAARALLGIALVGALGAGLAGAQLLPSWELTRFAPRKNQHSLKDATLYTLPPSQLAMFVTPFAFGDPGRDSFKTTLYGPPDARGVQKAEGFVVFWENIGYVGLLPLALAVLAVYALRRRDRRVLLLAGGAVLAVLLALGRNTPLFGFLWAHLPGMNAFRLPSRFLLITDLALAALAGCGFDAAREWLRTAAPRAQVLILALVVAATAADLLSTDARFFALVDAKQWLGPTAVARAIKEDPDPGRVCTASVTESWLTIVSRNHGWQRNPDAFLPFTNALLPDQNILQGVPHLGVYAAFPLGDQDAVLSAAHTPYDSLRLIGLFNTGYLIETRPLGIRPAAEFPVPALPDTPLLLYKNPLKMPRAYLAAGAEFVPNPDDAARRMVQRSFNPRVSVLIDEHIPRGFEAPADGKPLPSGDVLWLQKDPEDLLLQVSSPSRAWLVLSDTLYPGWRAYVDGKGVPLYRANVLGRAVTVPPGQHEVSFSYEPRTWQLGIALSAFAAVLLLLGLLGCVHQPAKG